MKLDTLIASLRHANPAVRLDVVRVLGMTDETGALEALRASYAQETDEAVRQAISWAGKRLYQAQQAGYSTLNEIFRHFNIDRELENAPDAVEAELMRKLENQLSNDLNQMRTGTGLRQAGLSAAAGLGLGLIGGTTMGLSAAMGGLTAGAGIASSSLGETRPQIGTTRTPPTAPSTTDISVWVKRLRAGKLPGQREEAIFELGSLNNPSALPHLAAIFVEDTSPQVRETAQRVGKALYWNSIYWDMERDGTLRAEMDRRLQALGKRTSAAGTGSLPPGTGPITGPVQPGTGTLPPADASGPAATANQSQADIAEILRRAQQDRNQRKRK